MARPHTPDWQAAMGRICALLLPGYLPSQIDLPCQSQNHRRPMARSCVAQRCRHNRMRHLLAPVRLRANNLLLVADLRNRLCTVRLPVEQLRIRRHSLESNTIPQGSSSRQNSPTPLAQIPAWPTPRIGKSVILQMPAKRWCRMCRYCFRHRTDSVIRLGLVLRPMPRFPHWSLPGQSSS